MQNTYLKDQGTDNIKVEVSYVVLIWNKSNEDVFNDDQFLVLVKIICVSNYIKLDFFMGNQLVDRWPSC
jgi:hypothetical protein